MKVELNLTEDEVFLLAALLEDNYNTLEYEVQDAKTNESRKLILDQISISKKVSKALYASINI